MQNNKEITQSIEKTVEQILDTAKATKNIDDLAFVKEVIDTYSTHFNMRRYEEDFCYLQREMQYMTFVPY